jgi:ADP-ribose pyrophosphatase YjhB (NUDIX family)
LAREGRGQGTFSGSWRADPFGTTISGVPGKRRRQRIAAYGVCRDDDRRILLARASPAITLQGRWFLPGGGVDHGESPTESLTREMEEESGLTVTVGSLFDVLSDVRTIPDGTNLHTVRIIYDIASWSGTLRPEVGGTTDAVGWFTPEEVRDMPLAHYVQIVVDRLW